MAYQTKFMKIAEAQAQANVGTQVGGPFGTVILDKNGKILATGRNHVLAHNDPTDHDGINAIRKACKKLGTYDLSGCTLYTNAIPCPMCLSAIIWANIKTCYYGNDRKDVADIGIGFRDDHIYNFIEGGLKDKSVLDLSQHDRDITIQSFKGFKADTDLKWIVSSVWEKTNFQIPKDDQSNS